MVLPVDKFRTSAMHVDVGGNFADVQDFLVFLASSINGDAASLWEINATDALYVELAPKAGAGAINEDDRILIYGGAIPNGAALGLNGVTNGTSVYICFAQGAGTTGPDNNPNVGNPYTGVTSSKLVLYAYNGAVTDFDRFQLIESVNKWEINLFDTGSGQVISYPAVAGRCHVNLLGELEPFVSTVATGMMSTNFESVNSAGGGIFLTGQNLPQISNNSRMERFNGATWEQIIRNNAQRFSAGLAPNAVDLTFTDITCRNDSGDTGRLHQMRLGYHAACNDVIDDGQGNLAYAVSSELNDSANNSTMYFMDV